MPKADYITTAEVAKALKLSTSTVTRLARAGIIPAIKVGKLWRFDLQDTQIRLHKQNQHRQAPIDGEQKNGWNSFLRLATDIGYVESADPPVPRGDLL
jgi:excisionase family DNA binding protein